MKNLLYFILPFMLIIGLTACKTLDPSKGKMAKKEETSRGKIESIEKKMEGNTEKKMEKIGELSYSIDYQINKMTNKTEEVAIIETFNDRILTLSPTPNLDKIKELQLMVDQLGSQLEREISRGKKTLDIKDKEISAIQAEKKNLDIAKDAEIEKYKKLAQDAAAKGDAYRGELDKYESYFGLGAIWMGFKRLFSSAMWFLIIGGVLFILLRLLATANPIAAAIFSIFEQVVAWGINAIKHIFPKALSMAGTVSNEAYNKISCILDKIVDNVEAVRVIEKKTGKDATLREVLDELSRSMDKDEKAVIDNIKKEFGY